MKLLSSKYTETGLNFGALIIRMMAGLTMAVNHGLKKITGFDAILQKGFTDPFSIGAKASLYLTIFAEFGCALLIVLGLFTRFATIPLIIAMCVALFTVHKGQVFGEGEAAALYLSVFTGILLTGPGKYSIDKMIGK